MSEGSKYISGVAKLIREGFPEPKQAEDWVAKQYNSLTPEERQQLDDWNRAEIIAFQDAHNRENS
jgi:hypothetical protein